MVTVEKNGVKITAKDKNQLAAFLNNGWKKAEPDKTNSANPDNGRQQYKKSEISKMSAEDLKKLAAELEINEVEEATEEKLKKEIIAKLGL